MSYKVGCKVPLEVVKVICSKILGEELSQNRDKTLKSEKVREEN